MTMKKHMVSHNVHIAAAAALVCFLQGCDGCGRKPQPEKPDPVVERVSDKEYTPAELGWVVLGFPPV